MTHLDGVYYDIDWKPLPQEEFAAIQRDLVSAPRWLIEGNYASTLPIRLAAADTVILLDLPAVTCLIGDRPAQAAVLRRPARPRWRLRPAHLELRPLYRAYRKTMRPRFQQLLAEHGGNIRLITLTSRRQAARFVAQLEAEAANRL